MDGVSWIKLQTDIFNNRKIRQIENLPDGDTILVIWFKLLVLAGNVNNNGWIYFTKDIPYTEQMLATEFNKPLTTIQYALTTFIRFNMIEVVDDIICVSNWVEYQNISGLDKVREQGRKRVQAYRERQKIALDGAQKDDEPDDNVTCNVTVTQSSYSNSNSLSLSNNNDKEKQSKKNELKDILDSFSIEGELRDAFIDFITMRKTKKRPLTPRALKMVITKLFGMTDDTKKRVAILNQTILHNWDTVYEIKDNFNRVGENGVKLADKEDHSLDGIF